MEFRQLQVFDAIATEKTITGAANVLDLAPSSVSEHLRNLERSLGVALFDRESRGMRLTAAGDRLRGRARRLLDDIAEAERAVVGAPPTVRLGALETLAAVHVPRVMSRLEQRGSEVHVMTHASADRRAILADVEAGRLDAGLLLDAGEHLGDLGFHPVPDALSFLDLDEVPVGLVVAASHPLAASAHPTAADLEGVALVGNVPACSFWLAADRVFGSSNPRIEAGSVAIAKAWAARGVGAAYLPDFATEAERAAGILRRLDLDETTLALRLVWRADRESEPGVRDLLYAIAA